MTEPSKPPRVKFMDELETQLKTSTKPTEKYAGTSGTTPNKIHRSNSLVGLNTLSKGITDMETLLSDHQKALTNAFNMISQQKDQIREQEEIIQEYHKKLLEFDELFDRIILS
jgi:hypothetical protein